MLTQRYYTTRLESPVGAPTLVASGAGLRAELWPSDTAEGVSLPPYIVASDSYPVLQAARRQLTEYFAGGRTSFDIPLDLHGTDFQRRVWRALASVPYGRTATYAEQAARIGRPSAVRVVGAANGRNPVSIILPCHRVVGKDGGLVGYAAGLGVKRWLLEHERANAHRFENV
ncbi:MAG: methylated-DNA--[protein]-cysteine S-methyltransferase [SAR202 cluster bacterium]|nr:methylated-DNA--[protein]-cysteine S-methyltransferase [SAR202 cluster bacterium]